MIEYKYPPYEKFSEIYDEIVDDRFYKEYYRFIKKILKRNMLKPRRILELACGTGKLTKLFHDKGYKIEGIDKSKQMLQIARSKGLKVYNRNIINFKTGYKYDLVLSIFDSVNYIKKISDLISCFKSVKHILNINGLFIFDINSDYKINKIIPSYGVRYKKIKNVELIWLNSHKRDMWEAKLILFRRLKNNLYLKYCETHVEKSYTRKKIEHALKKSGFKVLGVYSDMNFSKVGDKSERIFFVAKPKC